MIGPDTHRSVSIYGSFGRDERTAGFTPGNQKRSAEAAAFADEVKKNLAGEPATKMAGEPARTFKAAMAEDERTAGMPAADRTSKPAENAAAARGSAESGQVDDGEPDSGFVAFLKGLIDVINPLQHIPVISSIYRHITGDQIAPMARLAGDALFGGPVGAAIAMANIATEKETGDDIGGNVMAMLDKKDVPASKAPATMLASAARPKEKDLNDIQPASGYDARDIEWTTPAVEIAAATQNSPAPATPTIRAQVEEPAATLPTATPVQSGKNADMIAAVQAGKKSLTNAAAIDSVLQQKSVLKGWAQTAPAPAFRKNVRPEQVAARHNFQSGNSQVADNYKKSAEKMMASRNAASQGLQQAAMTKTDPGAAVLEQMTAQEFAKGGHTAETVPPQLVSVKMMEALDKYAALKKEQYTPGYTSKF